MISANGGLPAHRNTPSDPKMATGVRTGFTTGIPYSHTSNPLCERQIRVLNENVRIWCKAERTRDWMRQLPVISLMMNSQKSSATGYSPHELFLGRPAWFLHAPYPEDTHSSVGEWLQEQQAKVDKAKAMLQRVRERQ